MVAGDEEPSIEGNIRLCAQRIDAAAAEGADLALLPETYNTRGVKGLCSWQGAACMNEPAVTMLQEKAKQHRIYVAASVRLKDADSIVHNGIVMFDPEGKLIGTYTKCHLTMGEIWDGLKPGTQINTCDTALGRIGFSICWDRFFPEHARVLFMKHADIILNPTASSEYPLKDCHNGYSNAAFIVTAHTTADPSLTRITGRNGQLLAAATRKRASQSRRWMSTRSIRSSGCPPRIQTPIRDPCTAMKEDRSSICHCCSPNRLPACAETRTAAWYAQP